VPPAVNIAKDMTPVPIWRSGLLPTPRALVEPYESRLQTAGLYAHPAAMTRTLA
jgi:hypothetical protein